MDTSDQESVDLVKRDTTEPGDKSGRDTEATDRKPFLLNADTPDEGTNMNSGSEKGDGENDAGTNSITVDSVEETTVDGLGVFDWISICFSCTSLVSYIFDVVTDVDLIISYSRNGMEGYFWATLAFVVVPHVLVAITDLQMLWEDRRLAIQYEQEDQNDEDAIEMTKSGTVDEQESMEELSEPDDTSGHGHSALGLCGSCDCTKDNRMFAIRVILGVLGLGVVVRKLQGVYYNYKSKSTDDKEWEVWFTAKTFEARRDSSNLAFICAFTENCPQSLLQMYIFVRNPVPIYETLGRSIITSVINLPLAYANYYRTTRQQPKTEDSTELRADLDTVAFLFYYLGVLGAVVVRVLSIGLFMGLVSVKWTLIVLAVHFVGNFISIYFFQKPEFKGFTMVDNRCLECISKFLNTVQYSLINLFLYVDLDDKTRKRWRIAANYGLLFIESAAFATISFVLVNNQYAKLYGMVLFISGVLHIVLLPLYYEFLHPTIGQCFNCGDTKDYDNVDEEV